MMRGLFVKLGWADKKELDDKEEELDARIRERTEKRLRALRRADAASVEVLARQNGREGT